MRRKLGLILTLLGLVMLAASLSLYLFNRNEAQEADRSAQEKLQQLVLRIEEEKVQREQEPIETAPILPSEFFPEILEEDPTEATMAEMEIDGDGYIGFLSIPSLNLELPVIAHWSEAKLQIAPCRFTGNIYQDNLVIMAHNYDRHFGQIPNLRPGDEVLFIDVNGEVTSYTVILQEIVGPMEKDRMTAGEYDLTLFTCTYGGANRVTIRCDRTQEK